MQQNSFAKAKQKFITLEAEYVHSHKLRYINKIAIRDCVRKQKKFTNFSAYLTPFSQVCWSDTVKQNLIPSYFIFGKNIEYIFQYTKYLLKYNTACLIIFISQFRFDDGVEMSCPRRQHVFFIHCQKLPHPGDTPHCQKFFISFQTVSLICTHIMFTWTSFEYYTAYLNNKEYI